MKLKISHRHLVIMSIAASIITTAQAENIKPSSLQDIINKANSGPEVKAAIAHANEMKHKDSSVWKQVYLPKLNVGLSYSHLLTDEAVQLPPIGGMALPPIKLGPDFTSGSLTLSQVLFDPTNMIYNSPATSRLSESAELKKKRQTKETQSKAVDLYLRSLELRAKRKALEKYSANLSSRLREIRRIYELGGLSEGDLLKIKLGIDDANQGIRDLQNGEDYLSAMIATVVGDDAPIIPQDLPEDLPQSKNCTIDNDVTEREDILAIEKELEALELSRKAQKAEYLPKVYGFVQHGYTNTELVTKSNYDLVGVQLSWSLFDGGVNLSNARAAAEQRNALEQKKKASLATFQADLNNSKSALSIKMQEYLERRQSVLDAKNIADLEFKRLKNGKTTINNLIDAEDLLKDRTEKSALSRIAWYQAWFKCQSSSKGETLLAP